MNMKYVCAEDYWIKIKDNMFLKICKGFLWDGDSVIPDFCKAASMCHDLLYSKAKIIVSDAYGHTHAINITRKTADRVYKNLTSFGFRYTRYLGLRLFGWRFWHKKYPLYLQYFTNLGAIKHCKHKRIECYRRPDSKTDLVWSEQFSYYVI